METAPQTAEQLGAELKLALKDVGAGAKTCAIAVSTSDSLIRIIEQPDTPREILRDAIRLNGLSLLNQDVKEFVLDCEKISSVRCRRRQPTAVDAEHAAEVPGGRVAAGAGAIDRPGVPAIPKGEHREHPTRVGVHVQRIRVFPSRDICERGFPAGGHRASQFDRDGRGEEGVGDRPGD